MTKTKPVPTANDSHRYDISPFLAEPAREFDWVFFTNPIKNKSAKEERLVGVTNGNCTLGVAIHYLPQCNTWHVSGTLTYSSRLSPNDPLENTAMVLGAQDDILRTATELAGTEALDFWRLLKSSTGLMQCSDVYTLLDEAQWPSAGRLLQQEAAHIALTFGYLYDAANRVLFGDTSRCTPPLEAALKGYLPRDRELQAHHVDVAATQRVHEQLRAMFFMLQTADELLVKPKEAPTLN